jgi:predicted membrane GTPase involved in stress response
LASEATGIQLEAPLRMSLERADECIDIDEYMEVTPKLLRLCKRILDCDRPESRMPFVLSRSLRTGSRLFITKL